MSDRERMLKATTALTANHGLAFTLSLWGAHIVGEDNLADYTNHAKACGTDRWVGAHAGSREGGGAYWDDHGVLRYRHDDSPVGELWFSFNHEHPDLAGLLLRSFNGHGLMASWPGGYHCVVVELDGAR